MDKNSPSNLEPFQSRVQRFGFNPRTPTGFPSRGVFLAAISPLCPPLIRIPGEKKARTLFQRYNT